MRSKNKKNKKNLHKLYVDALEAMGSNEVEHRVNAQVPSSLPHIWAVPSLVQQQ